MQQPTEKPLIAGTCLAFNNCSVTASWANNASWPQSLSSSLMYYCRMLAPLLTEYDNAISELNQQISTYQVRAVDVVLSCVQL